MKNNLKIVYYIVLLIIINPTICFAKVIEIDNVSYEVSNILEKNNYIYDANQNTLTLKNAKLKTIRTDNNLKIILIGENKITNDNQYLNAIEAKEIEVTGDGSLIIDSKKNGIKGTKILINNTNLNIKASETSFSTINTDMIINNSNLVLESGLDVFNNATGDLYFNNSNINVNKGRCLLGGFNEYLYVNNSNLKLFDVESIRVNQIYIFINGNSNVFVNATRNYYPSTNYIVSNNLTLLGSDDNINYNEIQDETKYKYVKIESNIDLNIINQKLEELNNKNNNLSIKEEELIIKEGNLKKLEQELLEIENKNKLEKEVLLKQNQVLKKFEEDLSKEKQILEQERINLEEELSNLEKWHLDLNELESELNLKLEKIKEKEEELKKECELYIKEGVNNDNIKNDFEVNKEFSDYIDNPKTFNEFYKYISFLIISLIGILYLIIKRKEVLDG